jgi:hypothetical protein
VAGPAFVVGPVVLAGAAAFAAATALPAFCPALVAPVLPTAVGLLPTTLLFAGATVRAVLPAAAVCCAAAAAFAAVCLLGVADVVGPTDRFFGAAAWVAAIVVPRAAALALERAWPPVEACVRADDRADATVDFCPVVAGAVFFVGLISPPPSVAAFGDHR